MTSFAPGYSGPDPMVSGNYGNPQVSTPSQPRGGYGMGGYGGYAMPYGGYGMGGYGMGGYGMPFGGYGTGGYGGYGMPFGGGFGAPYGGGYGPRGGFGGRGSNMLPPQPVGGFGGEDFNARPPQQSVGGAPMGAPNAVPPRAASPQLPPNMDALFRAFLNQSQGRAGGAPQIGQPAPRMSPALAPTQPRFGIGDGDGSPLDVGFQARMAALMSPVPAAPRQMPPALAPTQPRFGIGDGDGSPVDAGFQARMAALTPPTSAAPQQPAVNGMAFKRGGAVVKAVWDKKRPKDIGEPKTLSVKKKAAAKRRAEAAGRPYPNLVDNIAVARKKGN